MINEYKKIIVNYYDLIKDNKRKLIPYYLGCLLNAIVELIIPIFVAKITETLTKSLFIATVISITVYFVLKMFNIFIAYFNKYVYQNFYQNNYITIYKKIVKQIYNFDEEYKKKITTGKMLNSLTHDIVNIGEMDSNILAIILNTLKCMVIVFYFCRTNLILAIFVIIVDLVYIARSNYLNNMVIKYLKKQREANDKLIGLINQTLLGLKDIQTLDFSDSIDFKYDVIYKSWRKVYNKKKKYERYRQTILRCSLIIIKTLVYFMCVYLIKNKSMTIGVMLIIISYFDSLFSSSESIMSASQSIKEQNISVNRIKEIVEYNKLDKIKLKVLEKVNGKIEFKNVCFSYDNKELFNNLNFTIKPNKISVIVGSNGAGKTTIINLILRLYHPADGKILLDDNDINEIDKSSYLNHVSILNQDTYLFNLSIRQNFNLINKDIKKQEEICKFIGIDKFIKILPKGYDTVIDENSHNISGGQKRLISLARTLLKESKILIFDEATSSLDKDKIDDFINVLKKLKENHTIIVVTHKKEIVNISDEVIIIDKGKIKINKN